MTSDGTEDAPFALRHSWVERSSVLRDVVDSSSITALFPLSPAHQKQGPFPPPALPGLNGRTALSAFRADHHPIDDVEGATFTTPGYPAITQITFSGMPRSLPRRIEQVRLSTPSLSVLPSPVNRRVGIHDFTFGACSSFTRVTACKVAARPRRTLVPRLRSGQLPDQTAR